MIRVDSLDKNFTQQCGSCVLASYAIVANYFSGIQIPAIFKAYCEHFNLYGSTSYEELYALHFDSEWKRRNCKGYEVILDVHNSSQIEVFKNLRSKFSTQFFLDSKPSLKFLEDTLKNSEAFLNITYFNGFDFHSVTIFSVLGCIYLRDTNAKGISQFDINSSFFDFKDAILYKGLD